MTPLTSLRPRGRRAYGRHLLTHRPGSTLAHRPGRPQSFAGSFPRGPRDRAGPRPCSLPRSRGQRRAASAPLLGGPQWAGAGAVVGAGPFVASQLVSSIIHTGLNLANGHADARRGADAAVRLGAGRVPAGGLVPPRQVLLAPYLTFGL